MSKINYHSDRRPNAWALLPLGVFLASYLLVSILLNDFYKMPIVVAFLLSSVVSVAISKGGSLAQRVEQFCRGAGHSNIMMMVAIFILAGAFAETTKDTGAIDAAVNLTLSLIPGNLLTAGIFIAACFISMALGTSVGTIVALAPVAVGIAAKTGIPIELILATVVGGAMFGDNLSFISDTTIVVTRTQGCDMTDKFKMNIRIALPIALATIFLYIMKSNTITEHAIQEVEWVKVIPYLVVLVTAICGMNVVVVLLLGIVLSGVAGLFAGATDLWTWIGSMGTGILNMSELIIVTLLAGGMLEMIRFNGGIDWVILLLTRYIRGRKGAEASMSALACFTNFCTANNTIALIISGPIAKNIAEKFDISPRRSASLIDIYSCVAQGIIPYGAQILMAAGIGKVSPIEILPLLYYPYLLGIGTALAIFFGYPRERKSQPTQVGSLLTK